MILTIASADTDDAVHANVFGAWSDLVVGERPDGLVDCYLVREGTNTKIVAIWDSEADHDRAVSEQGSHPANVVFEAAGLDTIHTVYEVVGSIHQHR